MQSNAMALGELIISLRVWFLFIMVGSLFCYFLVPSRPLVWLAETPYRDQTVRSNEIKSCARGKPADLCLPRGSTGGIFGLVMGFAVPEKHSWENRLSNLSADNSCRPRMW